MARSNTECVTWAEPAGDSGPDSGSSTADESLQVTPSGQQRHTARQVVWLIAKAVGAVLAVLTGAYAILSYYSSIAALHAAVEANRLTLLIYCDSNNSTDTACDQVRKDYSPDQAVAEVFHDELETAHDEMDDGPAQARPEEVKQRPDSTGDSFSGEESTRKEGHMLTTAVTTVTPTATLATVTVPETNFEIASAPEKTPKSYSWSGRPAPGASPPPTTAPVYDGVDELGVPANAGIDEDAILADGDYALPSDYSSWVATCTTLDLRMKRVRREMKVLPCTLTTVSPLTYQSLNPRPTSPLGVSCSTLLTQYFEAKRGFELYSCSSPWDPSIYTAGRPGLENIASSRASRSAATATAAPEAGAGGGWAKMCEGPGCAPARGRIEVFGINGYVVAVPLGVLMAVHVSRLLYAAARKRQRKSKVQSWARQDAFYQQEKLMEFAGARGD